MDGITLGRLANEAGFENLDAMAAMKLFHFGSLVAAAEREECAVLAEGATAYTQFQTVEHYKIAAAIAAGIRMRFNVGIQRASPASGEVPLE